MNGEGSRRKVGLANGEYLLFFQDLNSVPSNDVWHLSVVCNSSVTALLDYEQFKLP